MNCLSGKTRGTCDEPRCKHHGVCHCGCGGETKLSDRTQLSKGLTRDDPLMYAAYHHPAHRNIPRGDHPENGHVHDVPFGEIWYEWTLLNDAYPGTTQLARVLRLHPRTVQKYRSGAKQAVAGPVADRIREQARGLNRCRVKVPLAPLSEFMHRRGVDLYSLGEREERAYYRWRADGVAPLMRVDQICCESLGVHPFVVYGPSWFSFGEELEEAVS